MSGWYVKRNEQRYGPYSSTQLVEMAKKGQVLPIDWVVQGEGGKWMPASQVKGLFAALPQATAVPPPLPAAAPSPPQAAAEPMRMGRMLLGAIPSSLFRPGIGMIVVIGLGLLVSFFCGSLILFLLSFIHIAAAVACLVMAARLQKFLYAPLSALLTMTVWGWYCFSAVPIAVTIPGLLGGIAVGTWAMLEFFRPETRRQFADPSIPSRLERLPIPVLAGVLGGGSLALILGIGMTMRFTTGSKDGGERSANAGGERKMKSRSGSSDDISCLEKARKVTGAKSDPSIKPAEPGSLQDYFDALDLMALRVTKANNIRSGASLGVIFDPPCEASKWHQVFGEPKILSKGHERIGKNNIEFDRWQHKCTDGSLTFQGQLREGGGKMYYDPRSVIVDY